MLTRGFGKVERIRSRSAQETALRDLRGLVYSRLPAWHAPPLVLEAERLDPLNGFWRRHPGATYVVRRDGRVEGRLTVFLAGPGQGRFGAFDAVRDPRVARALFQAGEAWLRDHGARRVLGPFTFSMHEEVGLLTRGFASPPAVMMPYNPDYYPALLEAQGYAVERVFRTFRYRLARSLDVVTRTDADGDGIRIRAFDPTRREAEEAMLLDIYNAAFAPNWGFSPLSKAACRKIVDEFLLVGDPLLVRVAQGHAGPMGFLLCLPDIAGFFHRWRAFPDLVKLPAMLLAAKLQRIRDCRVITLAVHPDFQGRGISKRLVSSLAWEAAKAGYRDAELSYVDSGNAGMATLMAGYEFLPSKEYAVYGKAL